MTPFEALLLGLLQGLTEFLPVSSSGHLELGYHFLHIAGEENLTFSLTVHAATVLSTLVVFRKDILNLFKNAIKLQNNQESRYLLKLLLSAIPIAVVGLFFREKVESLFTGNLILVGICLLGTALLLTFAHFKKENPVNKEISWSHSFFIGLAQALAVLPGLSRSGSTIATGLILGNDRKETARFSFLMVLIPILGANLLDILHGSVSHELGIFPLLIGFTTAFLAGLLACKWMIRIVSNGKLIYFALYCLFIGLIAIFTA